MEYLPRLVRKKLDWLLDSLVYRSVVDYWGYDFINVTVVDDSALSDTVAALTVSQSITVQVHPVNDRPVVKILGTVGALYENEARWEVGVTRGKEDEDIPVGVLFSVHDADLEPGLGVAPFPSLPILKTSVFSGGSLSSGEQLSQRPPVVPTDGSTNGATGGQDPTDFALRHLWAKRLRGLATRSSGASGAISSSKPQLQVTVSVQSGLLRLSQEKGGIGSLHIRVPLTMEEEETQRKSSQRTANGGVARAVDFFADSNPDAYHKPPPKIFAGSTAAFTGGDWKHGARILELRGAYVDVQTELATLVYKANRDWYGMNVLTIEVDDLGNEGFTGGVGG